MITWGCTKLRSLEPPSFLCPSLESMSSFHPSLEPPSSHRLSMELRSSFQPAGPRSSVPAYSRCAPSLPAWRHRVPTVFACNCWNCSLCPRLQLRSSRGLLKFQKNLSILLAALKGRGHAVQYSGEYYPQNFVFFSEIKIKDFLLFSK